MEICASTLGSWCGLAQNQGDRHRYGDDRERQHDSFGGCPILRVYEGSVPRTSTVWSRAIESAYPPLQSAEECGTLC
jgi:hypothetical protein